MFSNHILDDDREVNIPLVNNLKNESFTNKYLYEEIEHAKLNESDQNKDDMLSSKIFASNEDKNCIN